MKNLHLLNHKNLLLCICTMWNWDSGFAGTHRCACWLSEAGNLSVPVSRVPLPQALAPRPLPHPGCSGTHRNPPSCPHDPEHHAWIRADGKLGVKVPPHATDRPQRASAPLHLLRISFLPPGVLAPWVAFISGWVSASATHRCEQGQVPILPWPQVAHCPLCNGVAV